MILIVSFRNKKYSACESALHRPLMRTKYGVAVKIWFLSYYNCLDAGHGTVSQDLNYFINPLLPLLVLQEGQGKKDCISGHCVWVSEALPVGESQQHLLCGAITLDLMWSGCPFSILGYCTFFHLSQHHNIFQHCHGGVAGGGDKLELN